MATSTANVATAASDARHHDDVDPHDRRAGCEVSIVVQSLSAQISKLIILAMMKAPMPIQTMPPPPAIISRSSMKKFCM